MVLLASKSLVEIFMTSFLVFFIIIMSSAYVNITRSPHIFIFQPSHTSLIAFSNTRFSRVGGKTSPCQRHDFTSNVLDISCRKRTLNTVLLLHPFIRLTYFLEVPSTSSAFHRLSPLMLS